MLCAEQKLAHDSFVMPVGSVYDAPVRVRLAEVSYQHPRSMYEAETEAEALGATELFEVLDALVEVEVAEVGRRVLELVGVDELLDFSVEDVCSLVDEVTGEEDEEEDKVDWTFCWAATGAALPAVDEAVAEDEVDDVLSEVEVVDKEDDL